MQMTATTKVAGKAFELVGEIAPKAGLSYLVLAMVIGGITGILVYSIASTIYILHDASFDQKDRVGLKRMPRYFYVVGLASLASVLIGMGIAVVMSSK